MAFRILALSGGGYLGLCTAQVLAGLEEVSAPIPLHRRFDLISGTSIGGILALALASGKTTMREVADLMATEGQSVFGSEGPPKTLIAKVSDYAKHRKSARYSPAPLRELIAGFVGEDTFIGDLKQKVVVPSVNVTKGAPQVFKTPHHPRLIRDWKLPLIDVALATSAAPSYFPLHSIGHERFADGGMYANSPDEIAVHEAQHFLNRDLSEIHVLSIGTTTSKFSFAGSVPSNLGWWGWLQDQRLTSAMIASQQANTDYMMRHKLAERYIRIDAAPSAQQLPDMALDTATEGVVADLNGLAEASLRETLPAIVDAGFLTHEADEEDFLKKDEISEEIRELRKS